MTKYVVHAPNRLNGKPQFVEAGSKSAACAKYAKANELDRFDCIAIEQDDTDEPPPPVDDGSCDPLYGQRMDSADMGEC